MLVLLHWLLASSSSSSSNIKTTRLFHCISVGQGCNTVCCCCCRRKPRTSQRCLSRHPPTKPAWRALPFPQFWLAQPLPNWFDEVVLIFLFARRVDEKKNNQPERTTTKQKKPKEKWLFIKSPESAGIRKRCCRVSCWTTDRSCSETTR